MLSIRYSDQYNLTTENYYTENETVLLPGGPGYTHRTGKDEGYCLQYPNGTKFVDRKTGLEYCEDGHSLEVTVTPEYKWQWKWVEVYEQLEENISELEAANKKLVEEGKEDKGKIKR